MEERVRACDEAVVQEGGNPGVYAEGLLNVCKLYLESPLVCMPGVSGSNLRKRIEAIMNNGAIQRLSAAKKSVLGAVGITAIALPLVIGIESSARAQSLPQFDVASIKPNTSQEPTRRQIEHGSLTYRNITLGEYIQLAYGIRPFQLSGPRSLYDGYFDIEAKSSEPVSNDEIKLMLQALLRDRFRLEFHRESKEFTVYALVVGKNGPKLTPTKGDRPPGTMFLSATAYAFRNCQMSDLARVLTTLSSIGRPVLDSTGLTKSYDFELKFDDQLKTDDVSKSNVLSLLDASALLAIADLGLKLDSQKSKLDVMVIDHVEGPSEN